MCIILNYDDLVPIGNAHDGIHFAADACIMDGNDHTGSSRDRRFKFGFIEIKCIASNIYEDRDGAAKDKGVDRLDKSEVGNDHFLAGLDIQQNCRHISACVQEVVSNTFVTPSAFSRKAWHF